MSDGAKPAKRYGHSHEHDWRVRPNQVIIEFYGKKRVRVVCATCHESGFFDSEPGPMPRLDDVRTWRKWRWD